MFSRLPHFVELFATGEEGIKQDRKGDNRHNQYVMWLFFVFRDLFLERKIRGRGSAARRETRRKTMSNSRLKSERSWGEGMAGFGRPMTRGIFSHDDGACDWAQLVLVSCLRIATGTTKLTQSRWWFMSICFPCNVFSELLRLNKTNTIKIFFFKLIFYCKVLRDYN